MKLLPRTVLANSIQARREPLSKSNSCQTIQNRVLQHNLSKLPTQKNYLTFKKFWNEKRRNCWLNKNVQYASLRN